MHLRNIETCSLCGSTDLKKHLLIRDQIEVLRCRKCGDRILNGWTQVAYEDEFAKTRLEDYFISVGGQRRRMAKKILSQLNTLCPKKGDILDIGCSFGWFLEVAREEGWNSFGIEPSDIASQTAKEKGLNIRQGIFPDVQFENQKFDVICMMDVIEHLEEPHKIIEQIKTALKPGGIVIFQVPNGKGLILTISELLGRILPGLASQSLIRLYQTEFPYPHLHFFTPDNMEMVLRTQNFEICKTDQYPVFDGNLGKRVAYSGKQTFFSRLQVPVLWCVLKISDLFKKHDLFYTIAKMK